MQRVGRSHLKVSNVSADELSLPIFIPIKITDNWTGPKVTGNTETVTMNNEGSRARRWCYTKNNYTDQDEADFQELASKYHVYGREEGKQGTKHLQGFIIFNDSMRFARVKAMFAGAHIERCHQSSEVNATYCKKDGDFWESGTLGCQGARSDLQEIAVGIDEGKSIKDTFKEWPSQAIRYGRGIKRYKYDTAEPPQWRDVNVEVWWGVTGTGKSRAAFDHPDYYRLASAKWYDGYDRQKRLVIDEFAGWIPLHEMLTLLDGHPLQKQQKGGFCYAYWDEVIITSNKPIDDWYKDPSPEHMKALLRRIDSIVEFHEPHLEREDAMVNFGGQI